MINSNTPYHEISSLHDKDNHFQNEVQTIFSYLKENVCTASMLSDVTGVKQKNICRYKRDLEKAGLLKELFKARCKTTGFKAWYITCNELLFPMNKQLKLF
ncbi:MAG: hypothetical protein ACK5QC_16490 [Bacteroidota bacterium]|nr:hypothetical protein [Bacteroidota bacterium]